MTILKSMRKNARTGHRLPTPKCKLFSLHLPAYIHLLPTLQAAERMANGDN